MMEFEARSDYQIDFDHDSINQSRRIIGSVILHDVARFEEFMRELQNEGIDVEIIEPKSDGEELLRSDETAACSTPN